MRKLSRRALLGAGLSLPLAAAGWSTLIEPGLLMLRRRAFAFARWPEGYGTLRIMFITDLHVGCPHVGLEKAAEVVARANAERPDLVLLGGDFVIQGVVAGRPVPPEEIAPVLGELRAPRGVYSVLGNHDWWLDGMRVRRALERAGIRVLENEAVPVEHGSPLWLAGLADQTTRRPDVPATLRQVADDAPVLALAHDPATFAQITDQPLLTLCGHTHGGQVSFPFFGPCTNASAAPLRWSYGHVVENGRHLFVSAGIGTSILPVRFNAPPEIVLIEIGPAAA